MKYLLRMVRPRFEVKLIEIEAESEAVARLTATTQALVSKQGWKLIERSTDDYFPHIERCLSETDLGANEMTEEEAREELASISAPDMDKYFLLYADAFAGEGELVPQPWMLRKSSLMITDLCSDWIEDLQELAESEHEEFEEHIREVSPAETANILLFKLKRDGPNDEDPPTGAAE